MKFFQLSLFFINLKNNNMIGIVYWLIGLFIGLIFLIISAWLLLKIWLYLFGGGSDNSKNGNKYGNE